MRGVVSRCARVVCNSTFIVRFFLQLSSYGPGKTSRLQFDAHILRSSFFLPLSSPGPGAQYVVALRSAVAVIMVYCRFSVVIWCRCLIPSESLQRRGCELQPNHSIQSYYSIVRFNRTIQSTSESRNGCERLCDLLVTSFTGYIAPLTSRGVVMGARFARSISLEIQQGRLFIVLSINRLCRNRFKFNRAFAPGHSPLYTRIPGRGYRVTSQDKTIVLVVPARLLRMPHRTYSRTDIRKQHLHVQQHVQQHLHAQQHVQQHLKHVHNLKHLQHLQQQRQQFTLRNVSICRVTRYTQGGLLMDGPLAFSYGSGHFFAC